MNSERTDRELLELAAKAAGYKFRVSREWHSLEVVEVFIPNSGPKEHLCWHRWNPPEDDGDALRLAVDLDIAIESRSDEGVTTATVMTSTPGGIAFNERRVAHGDDPHAATRRAIVLAAAAMTGGTHDR